jgi:hypothetical protein
MNWQSKLSRRFFSMAVLILLAGQGCTLSLFENPFGSGQDEIPVEVIPTSTPLPTANTTFVAILPEPLQANETLVLTILDEVTGLPFNVQEHVMSPRDTQTYMVSLPLPQNAIVKYKYIRRGGRRLAKTAAWM